MLELLTVLKIINRHNILYEVYGDLMKTSFTFPYKFQNVSVSFSETFITWYL